MTKDELYNTSKEQDNKPGSGKGTGTGAGTGQGQRPSAPMMAPPAPRPPGMMPPNAPRGMIPVKPNVPPPAKPKDETDGNE